MKNRQFSAFTRLARHCRIRTGLKTAAGGAGAYAAGAGSSIVAAQLAAISAKISELASVAHQIPALGMKLAAPLKAVAAQVLAAGKPLLTAAVVLKVGAVILIVIGTLIIVIALTHRARCAAQVLVPVLRETGASVWQFGGVAGRIVLRAARHGGDVFRETLLGLKTAGDPAVALSGSDLAR